MYRILVLAMLALPSFAASSPDPETILSQYRKALDQKDAESLSQLISPHAKVRLLLEQPRGEPLSLTLTRDEYLQQLRALWRFSDAETYSHADVRHAPGKGIHTVTLTQKETYQLFGQTLERNSQTRIRMTSVHDALVITDIEALTTER